MMQIHPKYLISTTFFLLFFVNSSIGQSPVTIDTASPTDKVFTKVDKQAEFPGGAQGWSEYLQKNLRYPKKAIKKNIQGVVRVQFLVDKAGNISEVMALNDPGGGLAEESVRIIANGPKWRPAEQNGKKVIYRHIQALTFKLE
jgi:periplasmic protein TonB